MALTKRSIAAVILLSIFTCGIYGIYWFVVITNEIQASLRNPDGSVSSGGMAFLLTILTCGFYRLYWYYKQGSRIAQLQDQAGLPVTDNGVLYLVLAFFGLSIVSDAIMQDNLNNVIDAGFKDSGSDGGWGNNGGYNNGGGGFNNNSGNWNNNSGGGFNNNSGNWNNNSGGGFNNSFGNSSYNNNNYGSGGSNRSNSQYLDENFDKIYRENSDKGLENLPNANQPYQRTSVRNCPACGASCINSPYSNMGGHFHYYVCGYCGQKIKYDND